jgi:hypothetical protein
MLHVAYVFLPYNPPCVRTLQHWVCYSYMRDIRRSVWSAFRVYARSVVFPLTYNITNPHLRIGLVVWGHTLFVLLHFTLDLPRRYGTYRASPGPKRI